MEKSKVRLQKLHQRCLRQFMSENKLRFESRKSSSEKIISPLAKYDSLGKLTCVVCRVYVKSSCVWKVHINSNQHKQKMEVAKKLKDRFLNSSPSINSSKASISCEKLNENIKSSSSATQSISINFLNNILFSSTANENCLPEKFFDDPIRDAKVRNAQYKDSQDGEWERFQREIKEESTMSNTIVAGEQDEAATDRQIKEIDEQIGLWTRVIDLEEKRRLVIKKSVMKYLPGAKPFSEECMDSDESDSFEEFSDWRSKKFHN